ncbi:zeta-carotene desaturase chloroplast precursor [Ochromonadaceae sp. CCMP2298]|nr:zeta-carotene desaturase chloroplast precursor [Ochromonadaceae sp. CCMP2298]
MQEATSIRVEGNEGLLDTARMDRAFKGTGVKISPEKRLKVGIIGAGLAGMITAMELSEAGHDVEIFDSRRFPGGKVGSWIDKDNNHVEMGLHVFFGCYYNLFGIMKRVGSFKNLRLKEHTHTFVNEGGHLGELDFRLGGIGAPVSGMVAFARTEQLNIADKFANALALATSPVVRALFDFNGALQDIRDLDRISFSEWFIGQGGSRGSINRMWDPICYALGFLDCDNTSARAMLTIFQLFAVRTEASVLRMLTGSPDEFLHRPIIKYLEDRGCKLNLNKRVLELKYETDAEGKPIKVNGFVTSEAVEGAEPMERKFDVVVAATDVPGIQRLLPAAFRKYNEFDKIYNLDAVPVQTVQLRFNGWVTELNDKTRMMDVAGDQSDGKAGGIDNLLYSADADFSCFADLAVTSPSDYYKEGEGSLMQCVLTPGDKWMPVSTEEIAMKTLEQVKKLFPSAKDLTCTWWNVVKLGKSLYRESPGMDVNRPDQKTPVPNFYLAGSYTFQDYIDSMEGATKSGMLCADKMLADNEMLQAYKVGAAGAVKKEMARQ